MQDSKILLADAYKGEEINFKSPPVGYTDINFKSYPELALIIGGETEGVSEEARTFCCKNLGQEIYIPIQEGVNSLNGGMATGIILSEIARQLQIDWILLFWIVTAIKIKLLQHLKELLLVVVTIGIIVKLVEF